MLSLTTLSMFALLEEQLLTYVHTLSLEMFVFLASFIEEVVAPIPSPTVMVLAGSFAQIQSYTLLQLIPLAVLGAFGKTIGAIIVYIISDKAEDVVMTRFGKFFNVTHDDVERFGKKLGKGPRDYFLLTGLRALPIMPSVLLSVGSGLLKVPMRVFIVSTFLGTIVRDGVYLYAGYVGTEALAAFVNLSSHLESYVEVLIVLVLVLLIGFSLYKKRKKSSPR